MLDFETTSVIQNTSTSNYDELSESDESPSINFYEKGSNKRKRKPPTRRALDENSDYEDESELIKRYNLKKIKIVKKCKAVSNMNGSQKDLAIMLNVLKNKPIANAQDSIKNKNIIIIKEDELATAEKSVREPGRRNSQYKECGGSSLCQHGRQKSHCKECGGSSFCQHGRKKSQCKECGGSGICQHGRQKYRCKECGGSGICRHGRIKYTCKECGGSSICQHNRIKRQCKECKGSGICQHDRIKSQCKECEIGRAHV
jgi:hypothetical protein